MVAINADTFEGMATIPSGVVHLILCDPPQGITQAKWDKPLHHARLWEEYERILHPEGCCVLFSNMPYTVDLVASNRDWWKYEWIWEKSKASNPANCEIRPMRAHEQIQVFCPGVPRYFAQKTPGKPYNKGLTKAQPKDDIYGKHKQTVVENKTGDRWPRTVLYFPTKESEKQYPSIHKTQKPQALLRYFIRTYTKPGEYVLDNTAGSFSTIVAALNEGRNGVGIEQDPEFFKAGVEWLKREWDQITAGKRPMQVQAVQNGTRSIFRGDSMLS